MNLSPAFGVNLLQLRQQIFLTTRVRLLNNERSSGCCSWDVSGCEETLQTFDFLVTFGYLLAELPHECHQFFVSEGSQVGV